MVDVDFGIEFEYMIVGLGGDAPGRILDFADLEFDTMSTAIANRPGRSDPNLATGDLGIKAGYWYLEGDERFAVGGSFRTLAVKGIEIRTPPLCGVESAVNCLVALERQLSEQLLRYGLGLGIGSFNPVRAEYCFDPPLNSFERSLRASHRAYDGSQVSTLSYGPDLNLSFHGWNSEQCLDIARKLNAYSAYIVPFSFSSPIYCGAPWGGLSKRTYERAGLRPAVKVFLSCEEHASQKYESELVHPARISREVGRIEFKAFDAFLDRRVLTACSNLLVGIALSDSLQRRSETTDVASYKRASLLGFADGAIREGAMEVLAAAARALDPVQANTLAPLFEMLESGTTPAHDMLATFQRSGRMFKLGGLGIGEI